MKKFLVSVSVLFLSLNLGAVELPHFVGTYSFVENDLQLQQIQHHVRLVASTAQGQELLQSYRSQNYACLYMGSSAYQCKAFLKNLLENPEIRAQIIAQLSAVDFSFSVSQDDYALVNEGEVIQEFEKTQKSSFAGQDFDKIHLYITSDLKKFKVFSHSGRSEHFYLNSGGDIAKQVQISKVNKKSSAVVVEDKYTYLYEAVLKQ